MTTIKINEQQAIVCHTNSFALAEWKITSYAKDENDQKVAIWGWAEYLWPSSMENAIDCMTQALVADLNIEISMEEFKERWNEMLELIYKKIDGKKTAIQSKGYNGEA